MCLRSGSKTFQPITVRVLCPFPAFTWESQFDVTREQSLEKSQTGPSSRLTCHEHLGFWLAPHPSWWELQVFICKMELIRSPLKLTASSLRPFSPTLQIVTSFTPHLAHGKLQYLLAIIITSVFLPGEFHRQRSLAGYNPWGRKESDTTAWLTHIHIITSPLLL